MVEEQVAVVRNLITMVKRQREAIDYVDQVYVVFQSLRTGTTYQGPVVPREEVDALLAEAQEVFGE